MREVLRRPDFRLLFTGLVASMFGESVLLLALAIWVKDLTGSDGMAGATIFAIVAPMALAPLVGWIVDRFRRRPFLIVANLSSAVVLAPLFAVRGRGAGALLVSIVDYRLLFAVMAVGMTLAAVYLWAGRSLSAPDLPAPDLPAPDRPAPDRPAPDGVASRRCRQPSVS